MEDATPSRCYVCGQPAGSLEHIFPKGIGGVLVSRDLLCVCCNNKFGHEIDASLCKQLAPFLAVLGIAPKRETRRVEVEITTPGLAGAYLLSPDGGLIPRQRRPFYEERGDQLHFHVTAADRPTAKKMLEGIQRTFKDLDVSSKMDGLSVCAEPFFGQVNFDSNFGGEPCFRAITKVAVSYALYCGCDLASLQRPIAYVSGSEQCPVTAPHYSADVVVEDRRWGSLIVAIRTDLERCNLLGYVELLGILRCSILLCEGYEGAAINRVYGYDLLDKRCYHPHVVNWSAPDPCAGFPSGAIENALSGFSAFSNHRVLTTWIRETAAEVFASLAPLEDLVEAECLLPKLAEKLAPLIDAVKTARYHESLLRWVREQGRSCFRFPCPCGSGRLFRRCHGQAIDRDRRRRRQAVRPRTLASYKRRLARRASD